MKSEIDVPKLVEKLHDLLTLNGFCRSDEHESILLIVKQAVHSSGGFVEHFSEPPRKGSLLSRVKAALAA